MPEYRPERTLTLLQAQRRKGGVLLENPPDSADDYEQWWLTTQQILIGQFGEDSTIVMSFDYPRSSGVSAMRVVGTFDDDYMDEQAEALQSGHRKLKIRLATLDSAIELVQAKLTPHTPQAVEEAPAANSNAVFLVHGHSEVRHEIARFLEKLEFDPIMLDEQANQGQTVIEKFEANAGNVAYAVVLLTGDDKGGPKDDDPEEYRLRARQNVILELGYFLGQLGRGKVAALYEKGVEIPSDFQGVLYTSLEDTGWKLKLAQELKAAGLPVDMNKAI